jgi:DNA polymerase I-like protein with 3'-5' exonuclease and polymerase domains
MEILVPRHRHFIDGPTVYFDTETTGRLAFRGDKPFAFSFMNDAGNCIVYEFDVDPLTRRPIISRENRQQLAAMAALLQDTAIRKVGFNVGFDCHMMEEGLGIKVAGCIWDVWWMSILSDTVAFQTGLKPVSDRLKLSSKDDEKELGEAVKACRRAVGGKLGWKIAREQGDIDDKSAYKADYWLPRAVVRSAPADIVKRLLEQYPNLAILNKTYAGKDAFRTGGLCHFFTEMLTRLDLWEAYNRELTMMPITYRMENVGVRVFPERCGELGKRCGEIIERLRRELSEIFGTFETDVPDARIRELLFKPKGTPVEFKGGKPQTAYGLPVDVRTEKTQEPSVAKEVMDALGDEVKEVKLIQEYKKHKKVQTHYVNKYLHHCCQDAANQLIIHAHVKQIGATTTRMAVSDPPLQQTPKRAVKGDIMKLVRWVFGPRKDHVWLHWDFKSIEPRVLAEEAEEEDILHVFNVGQSSSFTETGWTNDPYEVLVERVCMATGWSREYIESLFESRGGARQVCKNNFLGWTYGEGTYKLARQLGCSLEEAYAIINAMKGAFPGVMPFMERMQAEAKRHGFIRNRYGYRLGIPPPARVFDEEARCWKWLEFWYKATNYLIQSTAAALLKEAAIRLGSTPERHIWLPQENAVARVPQRCGYLHGTGCEIVMAIHDELIIECPARLAIRNEKFVRGIGEVMADNQGYFKRVKTPVDGSVTWGAWSDPEKLESLWN